MIRCSYFDCIEKKKIALVISSFAQFGERAVKLERELGLITRMREERAVVGELARATSAWCSRDVSLAQCAERATAVYIAIFVIIRTKVMHFSTLNIAEH